MACGATDPEVIVSFRTALFGTFAIHSASAESCYLCRLHEWPRGRISISMPFPRLQN